VPQSSAQEPQLVTAVTGASQPSAALPLQSRNPTSQPHFESVHAWLVPQALPQPPQLPLSDEVSISQPFILSPSQSAVPAGQTQ
jgi:hypothetical protein